MMTAGEGALSRNAATDAAPRPSFSICTLVTDWTAYARMIESFVRLGFDRDCSEFLHIDNTCRNVFDGFSGSRVLLRAAAGHYAILCHQDVELIADGADALRARLAELEASAPRWAIAGNAGARAGLRFRRISDPSGQDQRMGPLPAEVDSLDENFLVLRGDALVAPCAALGGFHHYGVDLCLQARMRGFTAHVIDFHLRHHSQGRIDDAYLDSAEAFEAHYSANWTARKLETVNRPLYLAPPGPWRAWARLRAWNRRRKHGRRG